MHRSHGTIKPIDHCGKGLSEGLRFYFYPHLYSLVDRKRTEMIVGSIKGTKVLDAGPGRGNIALWAWKVGYTVTAVDLSQSSLNEASFLFRHEGADIPLIGANLTRLPIEDESFDTVICADVIEHIPEATKALSELRRVLKKWGRLIISIPNAKTFGLFYDRIVGRFISSKRQTPIAYKRYFKITEEEISQFGWHNKIVYDHCQDFTFPTFKRLLNLHGFQITSTRNWRFLNPYLRSFGTLMGLGPIPFLERIDLALAERIPNRLAADWIFICEKKR